MGADNAAKAIGLRLKAYRKNQRWSAREFARRLDVPENTYLEWEKGRSMPGEFYPKIALEFGVRLEDIFGLSENEPPERILERALADLNRLRELL